MAKRAPKASMASRLARVRETEGHLGAAPERPQVQRLDGGT